MQYCTETKNYLAITITDVGKGQSNDKHICRGVNFINVLRATFTLADPESAKRLMA